MRRTAKKLSFLPSGYFHVTKSLYKALSGERSPDFDAILKIIGALGLRLRAEARHT